MRFACVYPVRPPPSSAPLACLPHFHLRAKSISPRIAHVPTLLCRLVPASPLVLSTCPPSLVCLFARSKSGEVSYDEFEIAVRASLRAAKSAHLRAVASGHAYAGAAQHSLAIAEHAAAVAAGYSGAAASPGGAAQAMPRLPIISFNQGGGGASAQTSPEPSPRNRVG